MALSQKGQRVRLVRTTPTGCKYLGEIEGTPDGMTAFEDGQVESSRIGLKNAAGAIGADTVEVTSGGWGPFGSTKVVGEAYACQK